MVPTRDELKNEIENGPLANVLAPYWANVFGPHHKPELDWRIGILKADAAFEIRKQLIDRGRATELGWGDQWSYELVVAAKGKTPEEAAPQLPSPELPSDSSQSGPPFPARITVDETGSNRPQRHGIFCCIPAGIPKGTRLTIDQVPVFRFGILQVFGALRAGPFLPMSDRGKPANLDQHFTEVCHRFVYSLQHLNSLMQRMAAHFESGPLVLDSRQIFLEAGCQADHVLTYLNTIVDDIAQVIVLATGVSHPKQRTESMGDLKHDAIIKLPAMAPVRTLLSELNNPGTWWELAFKPHHGARQLLIHNHYVVTFHGAQSPGEAMEAKANLISAYQKHAIAGDFFKLLREILASLCNWLDRLEDALVTHLKELKPVWNPMPQCPTIHLGGAVPMSGVTFHPLYFPLPLCVGSDPLPWTYGAPVREGAVLSQPTKQLDAEPGAPLDPPA